MRYLLAFVLSSLMMSSAAIAAGNYYLYGAIGQSSFDPGIDKGDADASLTNAGATNLSSTVSNTDTSYKVLLGTMVNENFGVEFGYVSLGTAQYRATFTGGNAKEDAKVDGFGIAFIAVAPINKRFSVFGKLGSINATVKETASVTGPGGIGLASANSTNWAPNFGAGMMFNLPSGNVSIRAEVEKFSNIGDTDTTGQTDATLVSIGAMFRF